MNKARRERLQAIIDQLEEQKAAIEEVKDDEEMTYENIPENLAYSDRVTQMADNIYDLETAASDLDDIIYNLQEIIDR